MATTKFDICSRALVMIGANRISSFDDATTESKVANDIYQDILESDLTITRWRFASKQEQLNYDATAPTHSWDSRYPFPSDCLYVHGVYINENPIVYDVYEGYIMADTTSSDTVYIDFTYAPDENTFPPYFRLALEYHLASEFSGSITRNAGIMKMYEDKFRQQIIRSKNLDSSQQTTRKIRLDRFRKFRGSFQNTN